MQHDTQQARSIADELSKKFQDQRDHFDEMLKTISARLEEGQYLLEAKMATSEALAELDKKLQSMEDRQNKLDHAINQLNDSVRRNRSDFDVLSNNLRAFPPGVSGYPLPTAQIHRTCPGGGLLESEDDEVEIFAYR